jgi:hypothetical protein
MKRAALLALLAAACRASGGAPQPAEAAQAVLSWEARHEQEVYGYLVYRAKQREGPYRRVNAEIVHAQQGAEDESHSYRWVDRDVQAGGTYYYYLDIVGVDGRKRRFSGVMAKTLPAG